jgi:hypothetical protein
VGKENARAEQTQYRRHYLDHRKIPSHPACERTIAALHSQKDSRQGQEIEYECGIAATQCPEAGQRTCWNVTRNSTGHGKARNH